MWYSDSLIVGRKLPLQRQLRYPLFAHMVELVDSEDLGSSAKAYGFESRYEHHLAKYPLDACGGCRYYELRLQTDTVKSGYSNVVLLKQSAT